MERYCGALQRAIRSRRFPYASLDRFVFESAQLTQIKNIYNVTEELALETPRVVAGALTDPLCSSSLILAWLDVFQSNHPPTDPSCLLLPPKAKERPMQTSIASIAAALATRFDMHIAVVKKQLEKAEVEEWGKVRRIDSTAGDTMRASSLGISRDDTRDATYVRVQTFNSMLLLCCY
jgi:hypothetical protein